MDDILSNIKIKMLVENEGSSELSGSNGIKKLLNAIEDELKVTRESILESIDISNINYVKSKKELDSIQNEVSVLKKTINSLESKVETDLSSIDGKAEIEEVTNLRNEINELKKASIFFEVVAQLHSIFAEFDNYLVEFEFDLAADALSNANERLSKISFDENSSKLITNQVSKTYEENDVFEEVKIEYLLRKGRLVSTVERLFRYIFNSEKNEIKIKMAFPKSLLVEAASFGGDLVLNNPNEAPLNIDDNEEIRLSLQDVWYALNSVGVANEHVAYLSKLCIDNILNPLISKACKLANEKKCEYKLVPHEIRSNLESKWEYKVVRNKNSNEQITVYEYLVPVILSLLKFISEDCLTGNIQVISLFGKCTWNWITLRLLQGIPFTPNNRDGQLLRELEVQSRSLQFISSVEDTISKYVNQLETSRYEERKINALSFARECIMRDDPSIVLVDDSTETESLTNLLKQCGIKESKCDKNSDIYNIISLIDETDFSDNVNIGGFTSIKNENESFLQLQLCGVSTCAHSLIQRIYQILDEAVIDCQKHFTDSANQGYYLVRELVMLFILLRPTAHKERLNSDPLFAATFYTDCSYLIHHLILIPFTYNSKFPPPISQVGSFVDLLMTLRKLQDTAISSLLDKEIAIIKKILEEDALSIESMKNMSFDQTFIDAETAYVDIVQRLKNLSIMFSSTLPLPIYLQSFGFIVDETIRITLTQVLKIANSKDAETIHPDNASSLVSLLNSMAIQIQKLFECHIYKTNKDSICTNIGFNNSRLIYNDPPSLVGFLNHWDSLTILRDTLDADIASIVQQKHKLKTNFKPDEIRGILKLNPFLSSTVDEVYCIIMSSE
ncbi:centromere protein ZW10 [Cryptosporidium ryanae]|uniref:centromere protein ZW10 n=1 Tax=Cryptosporidium ryanae TaxID=515981 RepID=UPI00351A7D06|nr:centromere protein ZW10 [Cryptosporidium ryanae]